jgi:pyrroline-5-carboxylate reductase
MVLDTTAWAQLGDMGEVIRTTHAKKIVLDHHLSGDDLGAELYKDTGAEATGRLVVEAAEHVLIAVKPQVIREVLSNLRDAFRPGQLLVSIAAGVSIETLADSAGPAPNIVRVMPNVCCTVGEAASAWATGPDVTDEQERFVQELLGAAGETVAVAEKLLDAVTGLSGSGPAFAAVFIEALADGGVQAGLSREQAQSLAAQTVVGAGRWVLENDGGPARLKDMVSSPGGTTITGLATLEGRAFRSAVIEAVVAAAERSQELGG